MGTEATRHTSRRNVLAAAIGGAAAMVAGSLRLPASVAADNGDPITVGGTFPGTMATVLQGSGPQGTLSVTNTAGSAFNAYTTNGVAIKGVAENTNISGIGVQGDSPHGFGVYGTSNDGTAIWGSSAVSTGVVGTSPYNTPSDFADLSARTGVIGLSGSNESPGGPGARAGNTDETGVYGYSSLSPDSTGVWGDTWSGAGVYGSGDYGVVGVGDTVGLKGGTFGDPAAYALHTTGRIKFAGRSGRALIGTGKTYVDVPIAGMLSTADVIATLRTYKSGYFIAAVVPYAGKFRVYMNKATISSMYISYLVIG